MKRVSKLLLFQMYYLLSWMSHGVTQSQRIQTMVMLDSDNKIMTERMSSPRAVSLTVDTGWGKGGLPVSRAG